MHNVVYAHEPGPYEFVDLERRSKIVLYEFANVMLARVMLRCQEIRSQFRYIE
jgi:hypothetical protein